MIAYLCCADSARSLLDHPDLDGRWEEPSRLERMTIGDVCGHLSRSVTRLPHYLDSAPEGLLTDAPAYYLSFGDPAAPDLGGEIEVGIRARAKTEAEAGLEGIRKSWDQSRRLLGDRLAADVPSQIGVMGMTMPVTDYLVTRMVELVVHSDDLAASLDAPPPNFDHTVTDAVIGCLVEIARRRTTSLDVIRAMTRVERARPDALRVF